MKKGNNTVIRATWSYEYEPDPTAYPRDIRAVGERARVDMETGQFARFLEDGRGQFRYEIVEKAASGSHAERLTA